MFDSKVIFKVFLRQSRKVEGGRICLALNEGLIGTSHRNNINSLVLLVKTNDFTIYFSEASSTALGSYRRNLKYLQIKKQHHVVFKL